MPTREKLPIARQAIHHHARKMRWFLLLACLFLQPLFLSAQEASANTPRETLKEQAKAEKNLTSLKTIAKPLASALSELEKLQIEHEQAPSEDAKQEIQNRIDTERERVNQLRENFRDILGGSEAAEYDGVSPEGGSIQDQISELIQPVLSGIREATSEPRELDALKKALETWKKRKKKTDAVLDRIDNLNEKTTEPTLLSELKSARRVWAGRQAEATSQIAVAEVQIGERTDKQRPLWETFSKGFSNFFKSRGMNLLIAVIVAVGGFFATRKIYSWLRHISPAHKKDKNNFTTRISDFLALAIAVVIALAGILIVFYVRGDWLLLTLVIIFLLGIVWAGKTAIPPYLDQIRMILNLGSVREGERVIHEGLPWKVSALGFYTTFTNPNLQGGQIRIPIRDVMGMISRPVAPREVWFPTLPDDWVRLSDGTYGKTITQTPDQVVVLRIGGSLKTYPTADFLKLSPENLSHGFRVAVTFGIDYKHRAQCTTTIPEIFKKDLTTGLYGEFGREAVRSIQVEFAAASTSSLDYEILADFDGSMAQKFNPLRRRIQKICVESCNENNWGTPFTQITVHQAEA